MIRRRILRKYDLSPHGANQTESRWWNTLRQAARELGDHVQRPEGVGSKGPWWLTARGLRLQDRVLARDQTLMSFWSDRVWLRPEIVRALDRRAEARTTGKALPTRKSSAFSPRVRELFDKRRG